MHLLNILVSLFPLFAVVLTQCPFEPNCTSTAASKYNPKPSVDCTSRDLYRNVSAASPDDLKKYIDAIYAPVVNSDNQNFFYYTRGAADASTTCVRVEIMRLICDHRDNQTVWQRTNYAVAHLPPDRYLPPEDELKGLSVDQLSAYRTDLLNVHANDSLLIAGAC